MSAPATARPARRTARSLRALGWFWAILLVGGGGCVATLQFLGAPTDRAAAGHAPTDHAGSGHAEPLAAARSHPASTPPAATMVAAPAATGIAMAPVPAAPATAGLAISPRPLDSALLPPDPALLEPAPDYPGALLPRIGADHRLPMQEYAAASPPADHRPRVAILLTGIGMSASEDDEATRALPPAVSFAISPYAYNPEPMAQRLRARGHESFLSLPMEPQSFPIDEPGPEAMLTGNTEALNRQRLEWALSRIAGYVGVTPAMGALRGERFAASTTQMMGVLREVAARGLMYVDARPDTTLPPGTVGRGVDVVLDVPAVRTEIDAKLAQLEVLAREHGSALGLAGPAHPVTVARLDSWAATLAARGFVLVPVSALATVALSTTEAAQGQPAPSNQGSP